MEVTADDVHVRPPRIKVDADSDGAEALEGPDLAAEARTEAEHGRAAEVPHPAGSRRERGAEFARDLRLPLDVDRHDLCVDLVQLALLRPDVGAIGLRGAAPLQR